MENSPRQLKRKESALAIALVAVLVLGLALIELPRSNQVSSSFALTSTASSASPDSLALKLLLNATSISSGHAISIGIDEQNTLPRTNNVSSAKSWRLNGLGTGPCGPLNAPLGIGIMKGYYADNNASAGALLDLYQPGQYNCPMILSGIGAYVFQPSSDMASVIGSCDPNPCLTLNMSSTVSSKGYWSSNLLQGATFSNFSPGVYTVVAGDEWGTLVLLHFIVR